LHQTNMDGAAIVTLLSSQSLDSGRIGCLQQVPMRPVADKYIPEIVSKFSLDSGKTDALKLLPLSSVSLRTVEAVLRGMDLGSGQNAALAILWPHVRGCTQADAIGVLLPLFSMDSGQREATKTICKHDPAAAFSVAHNGPAGGGGGGGGGGMGFFAEIAWMLAQAPGAAAAAALAAATAAESKRPAATTKADPVRLGQATNKHASDSLSRGAAEQRRHPTPSEHLPQASNQEDGWVTSSSSALASQAKRSTAAAHEAPGLSEELQDFIIETLDETGMDAPKNADDERLCVVCLAKLRAVSLVPCGCFCMCVVCTRELAKNPVCPTCTRAVRGAHKTFIP
jgi:hypothetical protein